MITYTIQCDWTRNTTFSHAQSNITAYVESFSLTSGMNDAYDEFAPPAQCTLRLIDPEGDWLPEAGGTFAGLVVRGVLVRIRASDGTTTHTLWQGSIVDVQIAIDRYADTDRAHRLTLVARDPMLALLDAEYFPPLALDATTDALLKALFDSAVVLYPYPPFILDASHLDSSKLLFFNSMTALEMGQTVVPFAGDNADSGRGVSAQGYARAIVAAEAGGRFFWDARTGDFTFHNRHHDALESSALSLTSANLIDAQPRYLEDLANAVTVTYAPRAVGAPGTTLYALPNVPILLREGEQRLFVARYATDEGVKVGALTLIQPVPGADYAATLPTSTYDTGALRRGEVTLTGADATAVLSVYVEPGAASAKITVVNTGVHDIYLTLLRLRGTPLETFERASALAQDAASIATHGRIERNLQIDLLDDDEFAQQFAQTLVARFGEPLFRLASASLMVETDDVVTWAALGLTIGDRVSITDSASAHDRDYLIVGERHNVDARARQHRLSWVLKPADRDPLFLIDASLLDSAEILAL